MPGRVLSRAEKDRRSRAAQAISAGILDTEGPIFDFFVWFNKYPSNSQIWHVARDAETDAFKPANMDNAAFGSTPAPKGHYVLKVFNKDRAAVSALNELVAVGAETTTARPSCVCSYAGRVFYSGVEENGLQGRVWFSRVVRSYLDFGLCYQEQDPTAEDFNELVATDGGEILIHEATGIYGLVAVQNGVIVLSTNGIWRIHGGDAPLTATNYSVDKIHASGVISSSAFTDVDGALVFCASDGIYAVQNSIQGVEVHSLTDATIKSFYEAIPATAKKQIQVVYSREDRKLYVFYGEGNGSSTLSHALIYSLVLNAWTPAEFLPHPSGPGVLYAFDKSNFSSVSVSDPVVVAGTPVVVSGDPVVTTTTYSGRTDAGIKLLTEIGGSSITLSELNSNTFKDWTTYDGIGRNYQSYVEVGPVSAGELMRNKQLLYITSYFNQTEDAWELVDGEYQLANQSGCSLTAKWGWADSATTGRWTSPQDAYKLQLTSLFDLPGFEYGYSVVKSKLLVRGSGRAFSVRWEGQEGKDMQLIGWAAPIKVNSAEE